MKIRQFKEITLYLFLINIFSCNLVLFSYKEFSLHLNQVRFLLHLIHFELVSIQSRMRDEDLNISLSSLTTVITALNCICDVVTSVTQLELRLQLSCFVLNQLNSSLLSLTRTICSVLLLPSANENVIWCACTQKELTNQHSTLQFLWSEKGYYLFKTVMVSEVFIDH